MQSPQKISVLKMARCRTLTSDNFSSHFKEISLKPPPFASGLDFTVDDDTKGTLEGDVTRVNISLTGERVSLQYRIIYVNL